jgi:hypothetical protein
MMSNPYWRGFARKFGCLRLKRGSPQPGPLYRRERAERRRKGCRHDLGLLDVKFRRPRRGSTADWARRCAVLAGKRRAVYRGSCDFRGRHEPFVAGADRRIGGRDALGWDAVRRVWAKGGHDGFAYHPAAATLAASFSPDWTTLVTLRALTSLALSGIPAVAKAYLAEEMDRSAARRRFSKRSACISAIRASGISSLWASC